jgi:type IV fimbrial biogenesis protein FimT
MIDYTHWQRAKTETLFMTPYAYRGMTLIEMMIVIAILSILLAIAVPSFSNLIIRNQMAGNISDFVGALRRAKAESSARLTSVTVCIRNGNICNVLAGAAWNDGWLVFTDNNSDGVIDINETIIYEQGALGRQVTFRGTGNAARRITFSPAGNTNLNNQERFIMCDVNGAIREGILMTVAGHSSSLHRSDIAAGDC